MSASARNFPSTKPKALTGTITATAAMAAGVTDKLWELADIVAMIDATAPKPGMRGPYKKRPS